MGFFEWLNLLSDDSKKDGDKSNYSDEELDDYKLFDDEKEEVKKGNYDPWNFEDEDTEEDDYYHEGD